MAKGKKSFVLYSDLLHNIDHLTNEEKGILFNHLLEYVNDMNPILEDRILMSSWKFIENQLKRDLKKFEEVKEKRSLAGKKSAEVKALKKEQDSTKSTRVESVQQDSTKSTVNDTVNVNDIKNKKKKEVFNFRKELIELGAKEYLVIDWLKVRKTKKATNSETAFRNFRKQIELSKININVILENCVVNSWSGYNSSWELKSLGNGKPTKIYNADNF